MLHAFIVVVHIVPDARLHRQNVKGEFESCPDTMMYRGDKTGTARITRDITHFIRGCVFILFRFYSAGNPCVSVRIFCCFVHQSNVECIITRIISFDLAQLRTIVASRNFNCAKFVAYI